MTVLITVNENSYISIDDADLYFNDRLYSDIWTSASTDNKARALIMACKNIEKQFFKGQKKIIDQTLSFPRCFPRNSFHINKKLYNHINYNIIDKSSMIWYCEEEVSSIVKEAQCEEAIAILSRGNSNRRKLIAEGVVNYSLNSISETFSGNAGKGLLSLESKELLKPILAGCVPIC